MWQWVDAWPRYAFMGREKDILVSYHLRDEAMLQVMLHVDLQADILVMHSLDGYMS